MEGSPETNSNANLNLNKEPREPFAFTPVSAYDRFHRENGVIDAESVISRYSEGIFFRRWLAHIMDTVIIMMIAIGTLILSFGSTEDGAGAWTILPFLIMAGIYVVVPVYFWLCEGLFGTTIGKWTLQIRVVKQDGQVPGLGKSFLRGIVKVLEFSPFMLNGIVSGIIVLATKKKQRLGDMAAGTFVLHRRDLEPLGRSKLAAMRTVFITLCITALLMIPLCIATAANWAQQPEVFRTPDGNYEITAPANWDNGEDTDWDLFLSNFLGDEIVMIDADDEFTLEERMSLEEYLDLIREWLPEALEAELGGGETEQLSLNGQPAYRFYMNGRDQGERQAYTVTVTGNADKLYCIVAWITKEEKNGESGEAFRQRWQNKMDRLDEIVGSFKSIRGAVSI